MHFRMRYACLRHLFMHIRVRPRQDDMVTERVLGMEFIRGTKATEAYSVRAHQGALSRRAVCAVLQVCARMAVCIPVCN